MKKIDSQKIHAAKRLAERYGLKFSQFVRDTLLHAIHFNGARMVARQSCRVSILDIDYNVRVPDILDAENTKPGPITLRCVYDRNRKSIATFLALDMIGLDDEDVEL